MKIRFTRGTTLVGGVAVNPGEVHDVSDADASKFVNIWKDAEYVTTEPAAAPAKAEAVAVEAPQPEQKKAKK